MARLFLIAFIVSLAILPIGVTVLVLLRSGRSRGELPPGSDGDGTTVSGATRPGGRVRGAGRDPFALSI